MSESRRVVSRWYRELFGAVPDAGDLATYAGLLDQALSGTNGPTVAAVQNVLISLLEQAPPNSMLEQVYGGPLSQNPDGGNDTLTFYDNSDTVTATGTADNLTFDGLHEDVIMSNGTVSYTTSGIANPGGNNNIGVTGSNDTIALAGSAALFLQGTNDTVQTTSTTDVVNVSLGFGSITINGGGVLVGGSLTNSTITLASNVTGTIGGGLGTTLTGWDSVTIASNDTLTFYDNSDTVTATGTADNLTFDGLHEDVIMSNGTVSYTTSGIANPGGNNNIGVTGSNDTIALAGSVALFLQPGSSNDTIVTTGSAMVYENNNALIAVAGNATITLGSTDYVGVVLGLGTIGFSTGSSNLGIAAGTGAQTVTGFDTSAADLIDLSAILSGVALAHDLSNLGNYVTVATSGSTATLSIGGYGGSDTVTLSGLSTATEQALQNASAFVLPSH